MWDYFSNRKNKALIPRSRPIPHIYERRAPTSLPSCRIHTSRTVYLNKYAHGFVVLCFVVVMKSFIIYSYEVFIHIHQGCFAGTGAILRLPQCQWSKPDGYGKISQCITTTKHSKAKTVCIFLGIYCSERELPCIIYFSEQLSGSNTQGRKPLWLSCQIVANYIMRCRPISVRLMVTETRPRG